jgi:hypothetical protein
MSGRRAERLPALFVEIQEKLAFVRTQIYRAIEDASVAIDIHCSNLAARQILTRVDGW